MNSAKPGFTLIELLVVVLIIGILASVAIPQYFKIVERGRAAEAFTALYSVGGAEETERLRTGSYTSDVTNLGVSASGLKFFTITSDGTVLNATRIGTEVPCPNGYGCYTLRLTLANKKIDCVSAGTDSCVSLQP